MSGIEVIKIINKSGGHCYSELGKECNFWIKSKGRSLSKCILFNNVCKIDSKSLNICNKIYGIDYKGEA